MCCIIEAFVCCVFSFIKSGEKRVRVSVYFKPCFKTKRKEKKKLVSIFLCESFQPLSMLSYAVDRFVHPLKLHNLIKPFLKINLRQSTCSYISNLNIGTLIKYLLL